MRLTKRGQDFLIGTLLATAISTITNLYPFLALTLALSLAAVASLVLFLSRDLSKLTVRAEPEVIRIMKRESAPVQLWVASKSSVWLSLSSALVPSASGLRFEEAGEERGKFTISAKYAGRYGRVSMTAAFVDVLGLFERWETVRPEKLVLEVMPDSLLEPPLRPNLLTVTAGEVPAGMKGAGQEFYGLEAYTGSQESRDILWKRVARSPDQSVSARVREANIPESLTVALVEPSPSDRALWMDSATEAMGRIGVTLVELGMVLKVVVPTSDSPPIRATDRSELADLLMEMWGDDAVRVSPGAAQVPYGPVITGASALADPTLSDLTNRISTFLVPDGSPWDKEARGGLTTEVRGIDEFIIGVILS